MHFGVFEISIAVGLSLLITGCGGEGGESGEVAALIAPSPMTAPTDLTIFYIDTTCEGNGDGSTMTCGEHGPFNSWNNISQWIPGAIYAGRGGTSETLTNFVIKQ